MEKNYLVKGVNFLCTAPVLWAVSIYEEQLIQRLSFTIYVYGLWPFVKHV